MNLANNQQFMIIDYEYAGWNPMAIDLANYINETMLDNAYPVDNGIAWYLDNCMQPREIEDMVKEYMKVYHAKYMRQDLKEKYPNFVETQYPNLLKEVWTFALLNNFFWGVWSLALLKPEDCAEKGIFNYDFAHFRCLAFEKIKTLM